MEFVALVTLLLIVQYLVFGALVGKARGDTGVAAPAVTGHEDFERAYRVQMNTLEQLMIALPAMWVCAYYFMPLPAALLGLAFFMGRVLYRATYVKNPAKRGPGMMIGFLACVVMIALGLWGVISKL